MNIVLKPEHEQFVQKQLEKGQYTTVDELIGAAFALLSDQEQRLEELRRQIAVGTKQIQQSKVIDGEAVFDGLQGKIQDQTALTLSA
jgi:antitoxin ParD1/3/4